MKALELTWKQRTADLKVGKQSWYDLRILLQWKNADREKIAGGPPAPNTNKNSNGWVERSIKFLVPDGAVSRIHADVAYKSAAAHSIWTTSS